MKKIYIFIFLATLSTTALAQCWQMVAPGGSHTMAIKTDGTLWAWGFNASGQLGDGTTDEKQEPVQVGSESDWKAVSSGGSHTLAIKIDGTLWAWGENFWGQVGNGTYGNDQLVPIKLGSATDWASVSAGVSFSMAIKIDGTLWAWGDNFYGQLGNGRVNAYNPELVGTARDWRYVSAGGNHTIALKTDNTLWAWGLNLYGQLGDGTQSNRDAPVKIGTAGDWQNVDAGHDHTIAMKANGTIWAWGNNDRGQLGNGTINHSNIPTSVGSSQWKSFSVGKSSTLGIKSDGTLWAWGLTIGDFKLGEDGHCKEPTQLNTQASMESVILGDDHAFAFAANGALWTWGVGTWGKLGNGTWHDIKEPQILFTAPPIGASTQMFCHSKLTIADIIAEGTKIRWYNAPVGGLELSASTELEDGGHYYATQTKYGCESQTRLKVVVFINNTPVVIPTGPSTYTYCDGETLASVSVSGANIRWYDAPNGDMELSPTLVKLSDNMRYYASQTIDGCESPQRLEVRTVRNTTPVPTTIATSQTFCESGMIALLGVTGTDVKWYADAAGGIPLPATTELISGMAYHASSTINSLESCKRLKVTAFITIAKPPTGDTRQAFCKSGDVANLKAVGSAITWYKEPAGGLALSGSESLVNGLYHASQKIGACESKDRLMVQVIINNSNTPAPTGEVSQILCNEAHLSDIVVNGQNIRFYSAATGGREIPASMKAIHPTYYLSQTIDACESTARLKVDVSINRVALPKLPDATRWKARMVSGSVQFSIAIMEDGTLWSWGNGPLGNGTLESKSMPTLISSETDWKYIEAGGNHVVALKSNGTLWAWGSNEAGQLGDGTQIDRMVPTQIGTETDWKMVSAGSVHTLALKNNGTLWACGYNHYWQTGIVTDRGWPLVGLHQVGTANDWESISAGGVQSMALKIDGTLWVWGKIGNGTNGGSAIQVKVPSNKPWQSINAGQFHLLGIKTDGSLWAWGSNEYYQLGDGTDFNSQGDPTRIGIGNDWSEVSGGTAHTIATKTDGTLWGWGQNAYGQVGVPSPPYAFKSPVKIGEDSDWKSVTAGNEHNFGIRIDNSLWAWGRNLFEQIGDGTTLTAMSPTPLLKDELYICGSSMLSNVNTNGNNVIWYDVPEGGNPLDPTSEIISENYYYVSQNINSVESCYRRRVRIVEDETVPLTPTGNALQTMCLGSKILDLMAIGQNIRWYDVPTGGAPLALSTILVNGRHYYASQRPAGCESVERLEVTVNLNVFDSPDATVTQTFCAGATVAQLIASGTNIQWYATADISAALTPGTLLENNRQYFVSQKMGSCESSRRAVSVTINPIPLAPTGTASQLFCEAGTVSDLVADGENMLWYDVRTGGTPLTSSTPLVDKKHYYASQQLNGCESELRLDVTATVTVLETPTAPLKQSFCAGSLVEDLVSGGEGIVWYASAVGGERLASNTILQNNRQYFSAQTSGPCESARRGVSVTIYSIPQAPTGDVSQVFCQAGTIKDLVAEGENLVWYDLSFGGSPLSYSTPLINNKHYYASQRLNGCESAQRLEVAITITILAMPATPNSQTFCAGATVANLVSDGMGIQWYDTAVGGEPLDPNRLLQDNKQYFSAQTLGSCASARWPVFVKINSVPPALAGNATQVFCQTSTVSDLVAYGENVLWYNVATGGLPLETSTRLQHGNHYYASQSINSCTSTARLDVMVNITSTEKPYALTSQTFCVGATIENLEAVGTGIKWYATSDSEIELPTSTTLLDGQQYFATQTLINCESLRIGVTVKINAIPPAPAGAIMHALQPEQTLSDLQVFGQGITWYALEIDAIERTNPLNPLQPLADNTSYFATQTLSGCESVEILKVSVSTITGLESANLQLIYYPNPVIDYLTVSWGSVINKITVQNIYGRVLFEHEENDKHAKINFTNLTSGVYVITVFSGTTKKILKIVKQ